MPISKITKTARGRDAISYALEGRGHDGSDMRNVEIGCVNMDLYGDYADQMQMYWDKAIARHKTQVMRVIQSFATEELNPNDENDILKANMIGQDFAARFYPGRQAVVFTQIDGKGGKVHNHIIINDVHMETYKGHTDEQGHYASVEKWTDEIASHYIAKIRNPRKENEKTADKETQTERAKREAGKFVWKDSLKTRIHGAMEACTDEKSFMTELERRGVTAVKRESKKYGTYFTYTLDKKYIPKGEKMPKNLSARSYNLGEDYGYEAMRRHIQKNVKALTSRHENASDQCVYPEEEKLTLTPAEQAALMRSKEDDGIAPGDWRAKAKKWAARAEAMWNSGQNDKDDEPTPETETEVATEAAEPVTETVTDVTESEVVTPREEIPVVEPDHNEEVYMPVEEVPAALPEEEDELQDEPVQESPVIEETRVPDEPVAEPPAAERQTKQPVRKPSPAGPLSLDDIIAAKVKDKHGPHSELLEDLLQTAHAKKEMEYLDEDLEDDLEPRRVPKHRPVRSETTHSPGGEISLDATIAARARAKERQMEQRRQNMQQRLRDQQTKDVADLRRKGGKIPDNYQDLLWNSMNKKKDGNGEEYE